MAQDSRKRNNNPENLSILEEKLDIVDKQIHSVDLQHQQRSQKFNQISHDLNIIRDALQNETAKLTKRRSLLSENDVKSASDMLSPLFSSHSTLYSNKQLSAEEQLEHLTLQKSEIEAAEAELQKKHKKFLKLTEKESKHKKKLQLDTRALKQQKGRLEESRNKLQQLKDRIREKRHQNTSHLLCKTTSSPLSMVNSDSEQYKKWSVNSATPSERTFVDEITNELQHIHEAADLMESSIVSFTSDDFAPFLPLIGQIAQSESENKTNIDEEVDMIKNLTKTMQES